MSTYIYVWKSADVNKHQIKTDFSYRLHVVLSYRERWTDWHQIPAHMMISSQSPYPTVTRMEISTLNRSVISSTHSLWALLNYWANHYLAMCTGELWIFIIKPIQIKMPIFILQTVPFKPHQQYVGQKHKTCLQPMKYCLTSSRSAQKCLQADCHGNAKTLFF